MTADQVRIINLMATIESQKEEIELWKQQLEKYVPADVYERIVDRQARLKNAQT